MADEADFSRWIDVMAELLELPASDEYRPGITANLATATKMARVLDAIELADDAESAPIYRA